MGIRVERRKVLQHAVVGDLAVHVDRREAPESYVDGDDRARGNMATVTDRHVGTDGGPGVHHGRPAIRQLSQAVDEGRLVSGKPNPEDEHVVSPGL